MIKYNKLHEVELKKTFKNIIKLFDETSCINNMAINELKYIDDFTSFKIEAETPLGKMNLCLYSDWLHLKFSDVDKAVKIFGDNVNPYSGKHNYHSSAKKSELLTDIFEWLIYQIKLITEYKG